MWKKLNQLSFSLGLAGLALFISTSKVNALEWNFSFDNTWGTASGQITTDGSDYSGGSYNITGISGTINGSPILSLLSSFPEDYGSYNYFYYDAVSGSGVPGGWVFRDANVIDYYIGLWEGENRLNRSYVEDVSIVLEYGNYGNFSATPAEVPFDFDPAFGAALGLPLFIGLRYLKKRVASKKLQYNPTVPIS